MGILVFFHIFSHVCMCLHEYICIHIRIYMHILHNIHCNLHFFHLIIYHRFPVRTQPLYSSLLTAESCALWRCPSAVNPTQGESPGWSRLLWCYQQCCRKESPTYTLSHWWFLFQEDEFLEVQLLSQRLCTFTILTETARYFQKRSYSNSRPNCTRLLGSTASLALEMPGLNACNNNGWKWYLVISLCIVIIVLRLSTSLLVNCISSLNCLCISFAYFSMAELVVLPINQEKHFCTLGI